MRYQEEKKSNGKGGAHKRTVTAQTQGIFNINMGTQDSEKDQFDEI